MLVNLKDILMKLKDQKSKKSYKESQLEFQTFGWLFTEYSYIGQCGKGFSKPK